MNNAQSKLVLELRAENAKFKKDMDEANRKLEKFGQTAERQGKQVADSMKGMDVAAREANKEIGASVYKMQEVGRQSQDIAVQWQAGTSPFVIMAQQGSQLAAVLGPSGPVIGAIIAFGGVIGGMLWRALDAAAAEAEEAREAFEKLIPHTPLAQLDALNAQIDAGKEKIKELQAAIRDADVRFELAPTSTISGSSEAVSRLQDAATKDKTEAVKQRMYAEQALNKLLEDRKNLTGDMDGTVKLNETVADIEKAMRSAVEVENATYAERIAALKAWRESGLDVSGKYDSLMEKAESEHIAKLAELNGKSNNKALDDRAKMDKKAQDALLRQTEEFNRKLAAIQSGQIRQEGPESQENALFAKNMEALQAAANSKLQLEYDINALLEGERARHASVMADISDKAIKEEMALERQRVDFVDEMVKEALKANEDYLKEREQILLQYDPATQEMKRHQALIESIRSANADRVMSDMEANAMLEEEAVRHAAAMNEINITAMQERGEHLAALMETYRVNTENAAAYFEDAFAGAAESFKASLSDAMATALIEGENLKSMMDQIWKTLATKIISAIINMGLEFLAVHLLGQKMQAVAMASTAMMAKATAIAWAPAAAMASLATAGSNAVAAQTGLTTTTSMAIGLAGMAHDGIASVPREGTWLLDKGERVFSADQNERIIQAVQSVGSSPATSGGAFDAEAVALLRQIAAKQSIVFNGPGWDARQIFDMLEKLISKEDRVLIRRGSRNAQELAA